jgi:hypothetical protein
MRGDYDRSTWGAEQKEMQLKILQQSSNRPAYGGILTAFLFILWCFPLFIKSDLLSSENNISSYL